MNRSHAAFTLVELVTVILILGILAAVAAPRLIQQSRSARVRATLAEMRAIEEAALKLSAEQGYLVEDGGPGKPPAELVDSIRGLDWTEPSPIGGLYDWQGPGTTGQSFGIALYWKTAQEVPWDLCQELDSVADEGDLEQGRVYFDIYPNGVHLLMYRIEDRQ